MQVLKTVRMAVATCACLIGASTLASAEIVYMTSGGTLSVKGQWTKEAQRLPVGTLYVPSAQKGLPLLAHLLEPLGPDSLLAWGFFNNHFEQKEYVEDYVLEPFARELLAKDPAVKAEWEAKLKDPEFASNPRARLRFFYERHPAYDPRFNLYPVFRTDSAPTGLQPAR